MALPFFSQWSPSVRNKSTIHDGNGEMVRLEVDRIGGNSLLVYKSELAVDRTAGDELGGLDGDVFGRRVGDVGLDAANGHQAGQVRGFLLGFTL